jgi:DNA-binding NarL/FixJ family response regulator
MRTALIVDDDPDLSALICTLLELESDVHCAVASNGLRGLEMWLAERHDVVVLDQRMPGIPGIEIARAILEEDPHQIVVLFSAYLDPRIFDRAHEIGVRAVLYKDQLRQLPGLIEEVLTSPG